MIDILLIVLCAQAYVGISSLAASSIYTLDALNCFRSSNYYYFLTSEEYYYGKYAFPKLLLESFYASQANFSYIDLIVYVYESSNGTNDGYVFANYLLANNIRFNTLWVNPSFANTIPSYNSYYQSFMEAIKLSMSGVFLGIATSLPDWNTRIRSSYFSQYTLLYYGTNSYDFNDFIPDFEWSKPAMKIYRNSNSMCGESTNFAIY